MSVRSLSILRNSISYLSSKLIISGNAFVVGKGIMLHRKIFR